MKAQRAVLPRRRRLAATAAAILCLLSGRVGPQFGGFPAILPTALPGGPHRVAPEQARTGHRPHAYHAQLLSPNGNLDTAAHVPRATLVEVFGLKSRDLVGLLAKEGRLGFDLSVRNGGVLVSLGKDGPAVVVGVSQAWILPRAGIERVGEMVRQSFLKVVAQDGEDVRRGAVGWRKTREGSAPNIFDGSVGQLAATEHSTNRNDALYFALSVTEALLVMFLQRVGASLESATAESSALLQSWSASTAEISSYQLEVLRGTKQRLEHLSALARSLQHALFESLGDENGLTRLASVVGPTSEEWELCFEYYSQTAEEMALEAHQQAESLADLESSISLSLSSQRLQLDKLQLYLDIFGNGLGMGALLTGAFGMNLISGLESKPRMFWFVFLGICIFCTLVCGGLRCIMYKQLGSPVPWVPQRTGTTSQRRS